MFGRAIIYLKAFSSILSLLFLCCHQSYASNNQEVRQNLNVKVGQYTIDLNKWYRDGCKYINHENRQVIQSYLNHTEGMRNIASCRLYLFYKVTGTEELRFIQYNPNVIYMSGYTTFNDELLIDQQEGIEVKSTVINATSFDQGTLSGKQLIDAQEERIKQYIGQEVPLSDRKKLADAEISMLIDLSGKIPYGLQSIHQKEITNASSNVQIVGSILQILSLWDPCCSCLPVLKSYSENMGRTLTNAINSNNIDNITVADKLEVLTLIAGREAYKTLTDNSRRAWQLNTSRAPIIFDLNNPQVRIISAPLNRKTLKNKGENIDDFYVN